MGLVTYGFLLVLKTLVSVIIFTELLIWSQMIKYYSNSERLLKGTFSVRIGPMDGKMKVFHGFFDS